MRALGNLDNSVVKTILIMNKLLICYHKLIYSILQHLFNELSKLEWYQQENTNKSYVQKGFYTIIKSFLIWVRVFIFLYEFLLLHNSFKNKTWMVLKSQIATEHWVLCIYMTGSLLCFCIEDFDINWFKYISTVAMFLLSKCSFRTVWKCRKPAASFQKPCPYLFLSRQRKQKVCQILTDADTEFATQIPNGGLLTCSWQWTVPPV